ncbi:MAG: DUF1499 domain-containing protein [Paracoccaceae bacterium]|nr:DUF1499 domain-containing protein [Paracoccaceae bacterium]
MMRGARWVCLALLVVAAAGAGWVRFSPNDPALWHADPLTIPDSQTPNFARLAAGQITGPDIATLAKAADAAMRALPRTRLLAGSVAEGAMTYITRSALIGFPDFTSIRVMPDGDHATLVAFARARFGQSDLGVNAARLAVLQAALAPN